MAGEHSRSPKASGGSVQVKAYGAVSSLQGRGRTHSQSFNSSGSYQPAKVPPGVHTHIKPSVFDFNANTGVCPTCQGTGRFTKAHSDSLVAIIPYSDKRLKRPRRWCCYFAMFLIVFIILASIALGLLFPRQLTVSPRRVLVGNWSAIRPPFNASLTRGQDTVHMGVDVDVELFNPNYASLMVNKLNISIYHDEILAGCIKQSGISLGPRADLIRDFHVYSQFKGAEASKVRLMCDTSQKWKNQVLLRVDIETTYSYIGSQSQTAATKYQFVHCVLKPNS